MNEKIKRLIIPSAPVAAAEQLAATAAVRQVYQNPGGEELLLPQGRGGPGSKVFLIHQEFKKYFRFVESNHEDDFDAVFAPPEMNLITILHGRLRKSS